MLFVAALFFDVALISSRKKKACVLRHYLTHLFFVCASLSTARFWKNIPHNSKKTQQTIIDTLQPVRHCVVPVQEPGLEEEEESERINYMLLMRIPMPMLMLMLMMLMMLMMMMLFAFVLVIFFFKQQKIANPPFLIVTYGRQQRHHRQQGGFAEYLVEKW